jgi:hypothetical protein
LLSDMHHESRDKNATPNLTRSSFLNFLLASVTLGLVSVTSA